MLESAGDRAGQQYSSANCRQLNFFVFFSCSFKDSHSSLGQIKSIVTGQKNINDSVSVKL